MNALILCNGLPPPKSLFEECFRWSKFFIAADGGANVAFKLGRPPDVIIGDMDSYEPIDDSSIEVIHDPDQYSNDLEKALKLAKEKGAEKVKVLGATGLRLDQTLKNLSVLKQFDNQFEEIIFLDEQGITKLLPNEFKQDFTVGASVSLFPLSGKVTGISTKGLKYELDNGFLENGVYDGSSNWVISSPVSILHKKGDLLLFIAK